MQYDWKGTISSVYMLYITDESLLIDGHGPYNHIYCFMGLDLSPIGTFLGELGPHSRIFYGLGPWHRIFEGAWTLQLHFLFRGFGP